MNFEPKELLLAKITLNNTEKMRPVIVISKYSQNYFVPSSGHFICVPCTSNIINTPYTKEFSHQNLKTGRLDKESRVICNYLLLKTKDTAVKSLGIVNDDFYQSMMKLILDDVIMINLLVKKQVNLKIIFLGTNFTHYFMCVKLD